MVPYFDKLLIFGDFNVHLCCPSHPLVKEFLQIIDSFNLTMSITEATHKQGHTLDLVISAGLSVSNIDIDEICVSDHKPVLFNTVLNTLKVNVKSCDRPIRSVNSTTSKHFEDAFF